MGRIEYSTLPVPAFLEHTVVLHAGPVDFGVEYRLLDEATILAVYGPNSRAAFGGVRPAGIGEVVHEDGVSLHVFDAATGEERLRFDCFDDAPHFHLLAPGEARNVVVEHDPADGPLLDWALERLASSLPTLLDEAGARDLASRLDPATVGAAVVTVRAVARYAAAAGRPVLTA
ncbi:MAG TPA: hypothetical protein VMU14_00775 [Acidimicrobiales bacterium]|nr:hypothetical protein [Acidimicrobiales bacterium]